MRQSPLEKRVTNLERLRQLHKGSLVLKHGDYNTTTLLEILMADAWRMKEQAEAANDQRLALACLQAFYRSMKFSAELKGELDPRNQTKILPLDIDPETAKKIAATYLRRHRPKGEPDEL